MAGNEDSSADFDIGLHDRSPQVHRPHGSPRQLPRWAVGVIALLIGFVVGVAVAPTQLDEPAADDAGDASAPDPSPVAGPGEDAGSPPSSTPGSAPTSAPATSAPATSAPAVVAGPALAAETVAVAELSGADRLPSSIVAISASGSSSTVVEGRIAGPTQASVGHVDRRVHVAGDRLVFVADRSAMSLDPATQDAPVRLVDAVSLLPGPERATVWVLGVDPRKVTLVDVDLGAIVGTYDLSGVGTVLSSFGGGLIVEPVSDSEASSEASGAFALWSPGDGLRTIWGVDAASEFIDAAGDRIVFQTPDGLAVFNPVTGRIDDVDVHLSARQRSRSFISPNGRRLAVVGRTSVQDQPRVRIHELDTGLVIDEFVVSAEWLLHWVSDDGLVYTSAEDADDVRLRNTSSATSRSLARLGGPASWVTVLGVAS